MQPSANRFEGRNWAINGRFLTQRMTGVQRYAFEIVTALDELLSQGGGPAIAMRLVVPPARYAGPVSRLYPIGPWRRGRFYSHLGGSDRPP